ncbi:MAG: hypothetical protein JWQ96_3038, partial [Segetibacter sp.]|nr:hypothetical protein [Segetibacter sp.]
RTIKEGQYYYKDKPIHLSSFSKDPEFPILSSLVTDMLRTKEVSVIKPDQLLPCLGIAVAEVGADEDLKTWAERVEHTIVLAGAAGFFTALLDHMQLQVKASSVFETDEWEQRMLFVCGTTFNKSRKAIKEVQAQGGPVSYMPEEIILAKGGDNEQWSLKIVELVAASGKAIIAIEDSEVTINSTANELKEKMIGVVCQVLQKVAIKELIVEGGSTASCLIRAQNFTKLIPVQELSAGVIRMKVEGKEELYLTIKPGSYDWSPNLWKF